MNTKKNSKSKVEMKGVFKYVVALLVIFISLVLFQVVVYRTFLNQENGAGDLRNRTIGSRLMKVGLNPYFYHWKPGDPEKYIDPYDNPTVFPNRVTVPPSILFLQGLIDGSYVRIQVIWYLLSIFAFLLSLIIFICYQNSNSKKLYMLSVSASFFTAGGWFIHLVLGQIYIFYVLIFAVILLLSKHDKVKPSIALIALLVLLRPFFILLFIPIYFFSKKTFLGGLVLLVILFTFFIFKFGVRNWTDYGRSTVAHTKVDVLNYKSFDAKSYYPETIEGVKFLEKYKNDTSLFRENFIYSIPYNLTKFNKILVLFTALITFLSTIYFSKNKPQSFESAIFQGLLIVIIAELLLPISRYLYYDVEFLVLIAIIINKTKSLRNLLLIVFASAIYSWVSLLTESHFFLSINFWSFIGVLFYAAKNSIFVKQLDNSSGFTDTQVHAKI